MSLIKKIKDYYNGNKRYLFTTPSHAQGDFIIPVLKEMLGIKYFKCDFSEIDGFDNLRNPDGAIKQLQAKIADIYDAKASFMLTNGSSSGIIAAVLSTLKENDKVLVARNCHISVYNALVLSGALPVWFLPEYDYEWGIFRGVKASDINKQLMKHYNIKALILTSPTYEGCYSEISEIAKICKEKSIIFIVDEAHGALYNFSDFNTMPAIKLGADISIQSLHKTAGAPNPAALLHISKDSNVTENRIQNALNLITTTSPSYPILCSIEGTVQFLDSPKGKYTVNKLIADVNKFRDNLPENIDICNNDDCTKLLIKIKGIDCIYASTILNKRFKIEEEYTTSSAMLFLCGIGTNTIKLNRLRKALEYISSSKKVQHCMPNQKAYSIPEMKYSPRFAYFSNKSALKTNIATGMISAEERVIYPPGIPLILPGEVITADIINALDSDDDYINVCI